MNAQYITLLLLGVALSGYGQSLKQQFEVYFKNNKIGHVQAERTEKGNSTVVDLKTETETSVVMVSVHVESEVTITYQNGTLSTGVAYRHANRGAQDVHAKVTRLKENEYSIERNGTTRKMKDGVINFCVADLFFKEPVGRKNVFSNMYGETLPLKSLAAGQYQLITPDKKNSTYKYQNGKLVEVETDTPVGKVVSRRSE